MCYIGIDIGKFNHCFSCISSDGEVIITPTFFPNNRDGFSEFFSLIKPHVSKRHLIGLEASGHYGDNLVRFLLDHDCSVTLINPLVTHNQAKKAIRKTKTDKTDSLLICNVLSSAKHTLLTKQMFLLSEAKQLTRYYATLTIDLNRYKNRLQKRIDLAFPEFNSLFKTKYSKPYMALLKRFGSAYNIANARINSIKKAIPSSRGRSVSLDIVKLKELAKSSIGTNCPAVVLEIQQLIQSIDLVEVQLAELQKKIEELASNTQSPIFSITGIGLITGMTILSEIGDFNRFDSADKIIAFAGLDPAVNQSGQFRADHTSISKRGSPSLRRALMLVTLPASRFNPTFKAYYKHKRAQGKSHRCAQGHLARKLCRIIFKLVRDNLSFDDSALPT